MLPTARITFSFISWLTAAPATLTTSPTTLMSMPLASRPSSATSFCNVSLSNSGASPPPKRSLPLPFTKLHKPITIPFKNEHGSGVAQSDALDEGELFRSNPIGELQACQTGIKPALRHQRVMRALRHNPALIQHDDAVGFLDGGKAVGHNQRRAPFGQPVHGVLHKAFAFSVQGACGLVQKQHRRIAQNGAGNGDPLFLTARQHHAPFAQRAVISIRQVHDEIMRGGSTGRRFDLGLAGVRTTKSDVFPRRSGKDHRVLRHQRDVLAKRLPLHLGHVHTVQRDAPRLRIIEALDHLNDRRLARARRADKGHCFARLNIKAHTIERLNVRSAGVRECHTLKPDAALNRRGQGHGCRDILNRVNGVKQLDQTLGRACRALQFPNDLGQGRDPARHHHGIDHKLNQRAHGHIARAHVIGPDPKHTDDAHKHQKNHDGRHQRSGGDPPLGRAIAGLGHVRKHGAAGGLVGKGLNRLHGRELLGRASRGGGNPVLVFTAQDPQFTAQHKNWNDHGRHDQQHQARQLGRGQQHQHQTAGKDEYVAQRNRYGRANDAEDQGGVGGDPAQNLAGHDVFVKAGRHADHAVEHRLANVRHDPFPQPRDQRIAQGRADCQKARNPDGGNEVEIQKGRILGLEIIDHAAHGQRQRQRHNRSAHKGRDGGNHQLPIGQHEGPERAQCPDILGLCPLFIGRLGRW
mmetsp:Transcript_18179/g.28458  ORF Transcript_18179/g.28458 Transcript_18179/m.28458 type:complete len:692 (-) Transcript_18179:1735-3810(-)